MRGRRVGRSESGPFHAVATRFATEHLADGAPRAPDDPAGGAEALRALAVALERWVDDGPDDAEAERRFVEGAGAYLAALLAGALGGTHFVDGADHGLHLGDAGTFDPFGAVEDALAAPDPRRALADGVRRAEAEAAGRGDAARVVRAFVGRLGDVAPGRSVHARVGCRLVLDDGTEVDLGPVVASTRGERDGAVDAAVARVLGLLPGSGGAATPWSDARGRLVPRLVGPAFLARLGDRAGQLLRRPLAGRVEVAAVLSYAGRSRFVTRDDVAGWEVAGAEVADRARANLLARSEAVRLRRDAGAVVSVRTGDALDAARLVLPELRARLVAALAPDAGEVVVAVPHRDLLLAAPPWPAAVAALRAAAEETAAAAPHAVTGDLFRAAVDGVSAVGAPAAG